MVSPPDLLEESCTRALVPSLSLESVQKSSPPHQFKQSILHYPIHNLKFQRDTRLSSPSHKKEKDFDSDIDSIASASSEELEKVEEEVTSDSLDQEINYSEELNALFQLKEKSQEGERGRKDRQKSLSSSVILKHLRSFVAECGLVLI